MTKQEFDFKIFILSENHQFRNTLASKLRIEGFTVEFASGGFHFLHLLERYRSDIHLLICHENMYDMSSEEIISLTRLAKDKTDLPIIFASRRNDRELTQEIIKAGANEIVLQSSNFFPLLERIHKYFSLFGAHKAA